MARVLIPCDSSGARSVTEKGKTLAAAGVVVGAEVMINTVAFVALEVRAGQYLFASKWTRERQLASTAGEKARVSHKSDDSPGVLRLTPFYSAQVAPMDSLALRFSLSQ